MVMRLNDPEIAGQIHPACQRLNLPCRAVASAKADWLHINPQTSDIKQRGA